MYKCLWNKDYIDVRMKIVHYPSVSAYLKLENDGFVLLKSVQNGFMNDLVYQNLFSEK